MPIKGFPRKALSYIVCQSCGGEMKCAEEQEHIFGGELLCSQCDKRYQIQHGILLLVHEEQIDEQKKNEITTRDEHAGSYDARLASRYHKEVITTLRTFGDVKDTVILEHGAGTGRLTLEYAEQATLVIACDFSLESLKVLQQKLDVDNVALVHADATTLITKSDAFDLVLATQFYEHIPDKGSRESFVRNAISTLKRQGRFISTTYHYDLRMRLRRLPQQGTHQGGIFFHYYTAEELKKEFSQFQIESIRPIDITLPLEARMKLPAWLAGYLSRICERVPGVNLLGHLLLVSARKP